MLPPKTTLPHGQYEGKGLRRQARTKAKLGAVLSFVHEEEINVDLAGIINQYECVCCGVAEEPASRPHSDPNVFNRLAFGLKRTYRRRMHELSDLGQLVDDGYEVMIDDKTGILAHHHRTHELVLSNVVCLYIHVMLDEST